MKTTAFRIIKSDKEYNKALKRIDQIIDSKTGTKEFDELELLSLLVEKYEKENYPIPKADPIEVIKFYIEHNGMKAKDLVGVLGDKTSVSKVLNKERKLNLNMIKNIHEKFDLPYAVLIS